MIITSLKRIFREGLNHFQRNASLSTMTIFVMVLTISLVTTLFFFRGLSDFMITSLKNKIDISVYFKDSSLEEEILKAKEMLLELPGVESVESVSREEALEKFTGRHQQEELIMEAVKEAGDNPFLASLNIRAKAVSEYETVSRFLEEGQFKDSIAKVDYFQRKPIIEKVFDISRDIENAGIIASLLLAAVAFSVTFVAIRLAIYNSREEISIMRLVGASNWFIRGPFIIHGLILGVFSALAALLVFVTAGYFLAPKILILSGGFDLFKFFAINISTVILLEIGTGVGLGVVSSSIAIRKYLET
jgi:cell division transport system permease protein